MRTRLYKSGAWAFIIVGAGHLLTYWLAPKTSGQEAILNVMREFAIVMPGSTGNLYQYHTGFSLMMGGLLIAYGMQALLTFTELALEDVRLLAFHTLVAVFGVALSIRYFFLVPVAFMALALVTFALCLLLALRTKSTV